MSKTKEKALKGQIQYLQHKMECNWGSHSEMMLVIFDFSSCQVCGHKAMFKDVAQVLNLCFVSEV